MDEQNDLRARLRAVGMELFRREGLRFTMQQAAESIHISKKTFCLMNIPDERCIYILRGNGGVLWGQGRMDVDAATSEQVFFYQTFDHT